MVIDSIEPGYYYHIYNRGINKERIFLHEKHYLQFLTLCKNYLPEHIDVLAYCLLPNHFHFLVHFKDKDDPDRVSSEASPCQGVLSLSHMFNAYAQWFNRKTGRTGGLFQRPFRRKRIMDEIYLMQIIYYIHRNPIHHHLVNNLMDWRFSSYSTLIGDQPTLLKRDRVLSWFEDRDNFIEFHASISEIVDDGMLEWEHPDRV